MSMNAAARVGDPFGHEFGAGAFAGALMGVLFARLPDVPGRAADVGRILVRGISGGRLAAADGQLLSGSANVFVNRQQATMTVRAGGLCRQHTGLRIVASGSYGVSINRQAAARVTDRMDCGAVILEGSSNVFIEMGTVPTVFDRDFAFGNCQCNQCGAGQRRHRMERCQRNRILEFRQMNAES